MLWCDLEWGCYSKIQVKEETIIQEKSHKIRAKESFINKDHTFWQYDHPTWFAPSLFFFLTFFASLEADLFYKSLSLCSLPTEENIVSVDGICVANVGYSSDNIPIWFSLIYDFRRTPKRLKWNQKTKCWFFMSYYTFSWNKTVLQERTSYVWKYVRDDDDYKKIKYKPQMKPYEKLH